MRRSLLVGYQLLTGLSDASTGFFLIVAPGWTLSLMKLHVASDALPYLSYIGAFVLSVGLACLYGARLATAVSGTGTPDQARLETVWVLTGITRGLVAIFVAAKVALGTIEPGWLTVACTDGVFALVQSIGLARGWVRDVRP